MVVVGGGTAGISVAARLCRKLDEHAVTIVEPAPAHYYQPQWTLVGGGVCDKAVTARDEAAVIPARARWVKDAVVTFEPERDAVVLGTGARLSYDFLVVCPGIQLDWDRVEGLAGNVGKHGICSNYSFETVGATWPTIEATRSGAALFTQPSTPIKCGGAPQKIMYLAESTFRRRGVRAEVEVCFLSGMAESFTVPHYAKKLDDLMRRRGIEPRYRHDLVAIQPEERVAVFACLDQPGRTLELDYSMIHVTPPMSAPDFVKRSPFADAGGWFGVHRATLRSPRYANVFALGDASSLPTSKTGAAIRRQAPVVAGNVLDAIAGRPLSHRYDGYTSCPIVTDYGKLILAEFDYDKNLRETFPFDQSKERLSMYLLQKHLLPKLYWHGLLEGRL